MSAGVYISAGKSVDYDTFSGSGMSTVASTSPGADTSAGVGTSVGG